jgi:hypothetical protein
VNTTKNTPLEVLRWKFENPCENLTSIDKDLWEEFLKSKEYSYFRNSKKVDNLLLEYFSAFLSNSIKEIPPDKHEDIVRDLKHFIVDSHQYPETYTKVIVIYKRWIIDNEERLIILFRQLDLELNAILSNLSRSEETHSNTMLPTSETLNLEVSSTKQELSDDSTGSFEETKPIEIIWNTLEIEECTDKHQENDKKWINSNNEISLIGARVRGKKHKHEGKNCDDWFEIESVGNWDIIAASDGAGSKMYSRVGAKASCTAAIDYLKEQLESLSLQIKDSNDFQRDAQTFKFINTDLAFIEESLHTAFSKAYYAVENAVKLRMEGPNSSIYQKVLGRELEVNDLSATLLLAIHTKVQVNNEEKSFILACQIGDGAVVAITESANQSVSLLGIPDGGEFSGETDFLTSQKFKIQNYLLSRTYPLLGSIRALMVMTDGVSDDYFPASENMLLLYDDLCSENILNTDKKDLSSSVSNLQQWLDTYQIRGSFDDRTLVVLFNGDCNE